MVYTTQHYRQGIPSIKKFLINRAVRILPLYYFGLLIAFLFGGAMSIFHYPDRLQNLLSALTFTVYNSNITPHYINDSGMYNVRWTLNYEVYFYIVFSMCLFFRHRVTALLVWGALVTCILPILNGFEPSFSMNGYKLSTPFYSFLTNPIILEFLIGAIAARMHIWVKCQHESEQLPLITSVISIFMILYIVWGIYTRNINALDVKSTIFIGAFVFIISLAEPVISKFIPRLMIYLGNISFSLYLLHGTVGLAVMKHIDPSDSNIFIRISCVILAAACSILVAHVSHKYIEVVFTCYIKRKIYPTRALSKSEISLEEKAS